MVIATGVSGFIGSQLLAALEADAHSISLRDPAWMQKMACFKPSAVVHLAGIANSCGSEEETWKVNVDGTRILAEQAILNKVKRFIFLSSVYAGNEKIADGKEFKTSNPAFPQSVYGRSKYEAEKLLRSLSMKSRMEVVIIRPPLVYGPGVKSNFRSVLQLLNREIPVPLFALDSNLRSFVGVSNLIHLILLCLEHPAAANKTFYVSDDNDISTANLLRRIGKALGKHVRNLPLPGPVLKTGLKMIGKGEWVDKLCGDLKVDISETKRVLGWKPKVTMEEELERMAKWWRESHQT